MDMSSLGPKNTYHHNSSAIIMDLIYTLVLLCGQQFWLTGFFLFILMNEIWLLHYLSIE